MLKESRQLRVEQLKDKEEHMTIKGRRVERVEIEVKPEDLLGGLQEYFGLKEVFTSSHNSYWDWSQDGNTLVELVDLSTHGSARYSESGRQITDERSLKAYMLLEQLRKLIEEKENEQIRD